MGETEERLHSGFQNLAYHCHTREGDSHQTLSQLRQWVKLWPAIFNSSTYQLCWFLVDLWPLHPDCVFASISHCDLTTDISGHYFTEKELEHLTISRNGTDGTNCTLKKAKGLCVRLSVLQRCTHEHKVSSEEFNDSNCLSCTYHDFTHLRN